MYTDIYIKILGETFMVKYSVRALAMYEQFTNKRFNPKNWKEFFAPQDLSRLCKLFYCCAATSKPDLELTYELFMDIIDMHPHKIVEFSQWLNETLEAGEF